MDRTEDAETKIWGYFDEAMKHADKAFLEADKAFAAAGKSKVHCRTGTSGHKHNLRFAAHNVKDRLRLTCRFFKMGTRVLFHGSTEFCFRER